MLKWWVFALVGAEYLLCTYAELCLNVNHLIIAGILLDFVDYGTENCGKWLHLMTSSIWSIPSYWEKNRYVHNTQRWILWVASDFYNLHLNLFQSVEDFILLIGTFVAFVAFVLWCCFPIVPKETNNLTPPLHYETRYNQYRKISDMDYNGGLWATLIKPGLILINVWSHPEGCPICFHFLLFWLCPLKGIIL